MAGDGDGVLVESGGGRSVVKASYYEIRRRFEGLLCKLWSEICVRSLPVPPMLGNGCKVDLYKLFLVVRGEGGYNVVCQSKLWDSVAEECGLGLSVGSAVKLVYSKYLSALDAWSKKVADSKVAECRLVDGRYKFQKRLMEFQDEVKGLLLDYAENEGVGESKGGGKLCVKKGVRNGGNSSTEIMDSVMNDYVHGNFSNDGMKVIREVVDGGKVSVKLGLEVDLSDAENSGYSVVGLVSGGEKSDSNDDGGLDLDASGVGISSGRKRKRESMSGLLRWVSTVAKNPADPAVGSLPDKLKWKSSSNHEVWKQVLSFREAVFFKRSFDSSIEQQNWQNQRMNPSMYDDNSGGSYNLRERLRHDKMHLLAKGTAAARSSSNSSTGSRDLDRTPSPHPRDRAEKQVVDSSIDGCPEVRVPVGPNHQAEVPKWTGLTPKSDSKWLGTQIWPSQKGNSRHLIERDPIGKGRQDSCGCSVAGSVECVRFHIGEKRGKVKLELGAAFYLWNSDKIGEEVRHLWTNEEEKRFKDVVGPNPLPVGYYFWDHIFRSFPKKSREDLVCYYFNVFLLQRRAYQNRHTPEDIDSDDDEAEDGLRNVFGYRTQISRCSILTLKRQQKRRKNSK
ncbi:putative transcription factor & chromatin remodeling ARID family [Lupinus albus]|uniref:Putative transcription factor & chromatin remodeling ARID family n=1 Tax=Lupinus albus TaxID=3870 RepID=A0A6A4PUM1_LUPAL|nr:putative transcription factor & chromatin remodeling ARID family [Lupinus albus]